MFYNDYEFGFKRHPKLKKMKDGKKQKKLKWKMLIVVNRLVMEERHLLEKDHMNN